MNFFEEQDRSRSRTEFLVILFVAAVLSIILAVYAAALVIQFLYLNEYGRQAASQPFRWIDPNLLLWVTAITVCIIAAGSLTKISSLRGGGSPVAEALGGRLVQPGTDDPDERRLLNVVEEMAIASGVPVPQVYVMDAEQGINAFAAGFTPSDAVIAVTRGTLEMLTRDELQGVAAHEFSHIFNGDMRLNIHLIGILSGILIIATIGYHILRHGGRARRNALPLLIAGLSLVIIGYGGVFVGRLIKSAVSRQREFLADASAVQFTRNPGGIAGALKKIGGYQAGSKILSPLAEEASHIFFGSVIRSLFATHPPLTERIRRIDPQFDGRFPVVTTPPKQDLESRSERALGREMTAQVTAAAPLRITADSASRALGNPTAQQVRRSQEILNAVPAGIQEEVRDVLGASALVCALLLDRDPEVRKRQMESLETAAPPQLARQMSILDARIRSLDPGWRLPLLDLAMPALRQMSPSQYAGLNRCIQVLAEADARISLFEFSLQKILSKRLGMAYSRRERKILYDDVRHILPDVLNVLSLLAQTGEKEKPAAEKAFLAGAALLPVKGERIEIRPRKEISIPALQIAFDRLASSSPKVKKSVFEACARCVLIDEQVSVEEAELLRSLAYTMDLPLPLFLP